MLQRKLSNVDVVSIKLSLLIAKENIATGLIRLEIRIYPAVRDHDRSKRIDKCDLITDNCDTRKAVCLSITFPHSFRFTRAELYFPREKNRIGELVSCSASIFFLYGINLEIIEELTILITAYFHDIQGETSRTRPSEYLYCLLLMIEKKKKNTRLN